jgi:DMSO/TMAO reductase YedYZ molybdopterin-dependent catalytic subunit
MKLPQPPGPFRPEFWDSPLRGRWMTSVLGLLTLVVFGLSALTGFLSHAAYMPDLGTNAIVPRDGDLPFLNIDWPTGPAWLYALTQGTHVTAGFAAIPILIAKLWSVMPRLFQFPPVRSPAEGIERISIGLFVASSVFLLATGVCNVFYYYPFDFNFVIAHYYAAVVFVASMLVHLVVKMPIVIRSIRGQGLIAPLRDDLEHTKPEPDDGEGLRAKYPRDPTMSRRGLVGFALGGSALLTVGIAGQSIGGPLRQVAFLAPRRGGFGDGPNDFAVNKTASAARITPEMVGDAYRLELRFGDRTVSLSRRELMGMQQRTEALPIACVEGWSTTQDWTGVQLAALAAAVGAQDADQVLVESLQPRGVLRRAALSHDQFSTDRALLALQVNGAALSADHGYPARIIVPGLPGVHNTKWVGKMTFS